MIYGWTRDSDHKARTCRCEPHRVKSLLTVATIFFALVYAYTHMFVEPDDEQATLDLSSLFICPTVEARARESLDVLLSGLRLTLHGTPWTVTPI